MEAQTEAASTRSASFQQQLVLGNDVKGQQRVLDALRMYGQLTRDEIADATGMRLSSVCGRCNELLKAGKIESKGRKYNQGTRSSSQLLVIKI